MVAGPNSSLPGPSFTPKLKPTNFDEILCYAPPPMVNAKRKIEICKTLLPVMDSSISPLLSERGPSQDTPLIQPSDSGFRASYNIQNTKPYDNVSQKRYL